MTYAIDLARNIYYWAITVGFFLVFTIVGTILFVRADRNR